MIRNLKALALALVAVFAMSAVAASGAQATDGTFSWESGTVKLKAAQDPTEPSQVFKTTAGTVTCDTVKGEAPVTGTGETTILTKEITYTDSKLEAEGKKDTCTGPFGTQPKINMNGCSYTFHAGTTVKGTAGSTNGETEGTVDIVCPAGNEIKIEAPGCNINVPPTEGLGPVYFRTVKTGEKHEVTIDAKVGDGPATHLKAIKYSHSGFLCGTGSGTDGTYTGKVTVEARSGIDKQLHVTVT